MPSPEELERANADKRPSGQVYKNVQRLKEMPAGRLPLVMKMFTKVLGVDCSFCHELGAFEKDDNPNKETARKMLSLTGAISKEIYKGPSPINCYTCHRGREHPVSMPPANNQQIKD